MNTESKSITVMGHARAKSGHEDDVRKALKAFVEPARREEGCVSYELFEDLYYAGSFYTVEEWASEHALETHVKVQKPDMNKLLPLLSDEIRISVVKALK